MQYFKFTKSELTGQVPQAVMDGFDDWSFEEVIWLGERHGFDLEEKKSDKQITRFFDGGYVLGMSAYFAEMLIAKECGYFPATPDEIARVKLERQARKFQAEVARQRQRPRRDDVEREQVFGEALRTVRPGVITVSVPKSKNARVGRSVQVEVIHRDRFGPNRPFRRPWS